jgi:hypothetical protein
MNDTAKLRTRFVVAVALTLVCFSAGAAMAASNKLIVKGTDGTTDAMVVNDQGNIGIGTSSPYYPIQIKMGGPTSATTLEFRNTGNSTYSQYDAPTIQMARNNISTVNNGIPQSNDRLGAFQFGAYFDTSIKYAAGIYANAEGNSWSSTSYPGYLSFSTTPANSAYPWERVRITSTGNVGIATTTPAQKLEINGGVRLNTSTSRPACNTNSRGTIWFTQGSTGVADKLEVCVKQADENYAWKALF